MGNCMQAPKPRQFVSWRRTEGSETLPEDQNDELFAPKRPPWLKLNGPFGLACGWGVSDLSLSPDGRYAFCFGHGVRRFVVLDLVRHIQLVFVSKYSSPSFIQDFAVVSPTTIVALQVDSLHLIRLDMESRTFEWFGWGGRPERDTTFVFTEIRGRDVHLKQTVLNSLEAERIRFVRLDIERGQLEEVWSERPEFPWSSYRLSDDGRLLFGISRSDFSCLRVFDLESKPWSWTRLAGDIPRFDSGSFYWTSQERAYFAGLKFFGKRLRHFVYCCDLERLEWRNLSITTGPELLRIASVVDEEGEPNGMMLVEKNAHDNHLDFHRFLFRQDARLASPFGGGCPPSKSN
ncbi:hypothetical protein M3Y99_01035700 [Aphelenchoides fujianensis]|nr:hypothetical protein M3Y99_01035700 [Aphelenchoides fujianensis]